jgi:zinc protease
MKFSTRAFKNLAILASLLSYSSMIFNNMTVQAQTASESNLKIKTPKGKIEYVSTLNGITEYKLDNGLKIISMPDESAPLVSVQVWYKVGSKEEHDNYTGIAHFLEHMMFKGTDNFKKGEIAQAIQLKGGVFNAFTSYDYTGYYENFAPENLELAIKIESDRMRNSNLSQKEIDLERSVIISELEGGENYPSQMANKQLRAAAFLKHSYHNPIIGWRQDLDNIDEKHMREFYNKYYYPDNAFVVVAGNFKPEVALDLIEYYFGAYPKRKAAELAVETKAVEPEQKELRQVTMFNEGHTKLLSMAFHIPAFGHEDSAALNLIDEVVFSGTNSRLHRKLIDTGLALRVSGYAESSKDPGLYRIRVNINEDADIKEVEAIVDAELEAIKKEITDEEYEIAQSRVESSVIYQRDGVYEEAMQVAYFEVITGKWQDYFTWIEKLKNTTKDDIKEVAKKYFIPSNKTVVYLLPQAEPSSLTFNDKSKDTTKPATKNKDATTETSKSSGGSSGAASNKKSQVKEEQSYKLDVLSETDLNHAYFNAAKVEPLSPDKLQHLLKVTAPSHRKDIKSASLDLNLEKFKVENLPGAEFVLKEDHSLPLIYLQGSFYAGSALEEEDQYGIAYMTSAMLDRGTLKRDKYELTADLDRIGAEVDFSSGKEYTELQISTLSKNLDKALEIFEEIITEPAFDVKEFERLKSETIAAIKQQQEYPSSIARRQLYQMIYPKGHLNYSLSIEERIAAVEKIKLEDIKSFYKKYYNANNMQVAIVGDITKAAIKNTFAKSLAKLNPDSKYIGKKPADELVEPKAAQEKFIDKPGKKQTEIYLGHSTELTRNHPDFYPLLLANFALGGSPLSSRLGTVVRDEHGLVYNIRSGFYSTLTSGPFLVTLGANPSNVKKAIALTKEEISKYLKEGISATELEATKSYLKGSFAVRNLSSNSEMVDTFAQMLTFDLPLNYPENYDEIIDKVTIEQVNAAARKHIHPDKLQVVAVGPVITGSKSTNDTNKKDDKSATK